MQRIDDASFCPATYLEQAHLGGRIVEVKPNQVFFCQGDAADSVFHLQRGRAKLDVVSAHGREATITILSAGDFIGEEALAGVSTRRLATATAVNACTALRIGKDKMSRVMREDHVFTQAFVRFLLARGMRTQADLLDHLFNSSERRLARTLVLMTRFGQVSEEDAFIPPITQLSLAEMVGTTRSRISFFMNRFRKLGYIDYSKNRRIKVRKALLNSLLLDHHPEQNLRSSALPSSSDYWQPEMHSRAKVVGIGQYL